MKKKLFLPGIFLLSLFTLTACTASSKAEAIASITAAPLVTPVVSIAADASGWTVEESLDAFDATDSFEIDPDDIPLQNTPNSSCFSSIGYDEASQTLVVVFRDSGKKYAYENFPGSEWNAFENADSLGGYYNDYIKGTYDCINLQ